MRLKLPSASVSLSWLASSAKRSQVIGPLATSSSAGSIAGFLEHALVIEESARVGVEGEGKRGALECRLRLSEGDVPGQVGAKLAEILEHALRGALGDDEAVEHVDVGADAAADGGHQAGRVGLASDLLESA